MKHVITLEIELVELSDAERKELAEQIGMTPDELGNAEDVGTGQLADLIAGYIENDDGELWAGSDSYARIVSVTPA